MTPPEKLAVGLVFTACAGFTDAIGLLELGGHFVSFMSGNTTQLGAVLGDRQVDAPLLLLALVVLFFLGSLFGSYVALSNRRWGSATTLGLVLAIILVALAASRLGAPAGFAIPLLALSGGAQNAVLPARGAARLGATFVTGTLFAAAQDLARALLGKAPPWRWAQHLAVWGSLCAGAAIGAFAHGLWGIPSLLVPALVYLGFLAAFLRQGPAPEIGKVMS
jgi:uncharacterized membrane protein YoaK (UPF0700 family)